MMEAAKQVCTYEQAVTLRDLGIKQQSTFWHVKTSSDRNQNISTFPSIHDALKKYQDWKRFDQHLLSTTEEPVAAFSVAELGVMLKRGSRLAERFYNDLQRKINGGNSITIVYQPQFLADFIIKEIQEGRTTAEELNACLQAC